MIRFSMLLAAFALCFSGSALAEKPAGAPAMPQAIVAGPQHAHYAKMAGKWTVAQTMYMPDGKSMKSAGTQVNTVVLGGLGISFSYEGAMGPGMKMLGHGFQTWVPGKKQFESYWFDNFSTHGSSHGWGTWDDKTKTMNEVMTGPGPDGKEMKIRMATKVISDDESVMSMFIKGPDGKEMKMMEMVYKRAK